MSLLTGLYRLWQSTLVTILRNRRLIAGFAVSLTGVAVGLTVFFGVVRPKPASRSTQGPVTVRSAGGSWDGGLAMRYAKAVQSGDCEDVLRTTAWMVDRLRRVALELPDPAQVETVKQDLCGQIRNRSPEGNALRAEGIEDQYVFAPGARFEVANIDEGRDDLGSPVECRVWLRVTYPSRDKAPLVQVEEGSSVMQPIREWNVGVNLSRTENVVLKAGVIGNLDIDFDSLAFDWPNAS